MTVREPEICLVTRWSTIIFADEAGVLRHGAPGEVPHNVRLAPSGYIEINGAPEPDTEIVTLAGRFSIGLRKSGLLYSAEPDGEMTVSRHELQEWETFLPLAASMVFNLPELARHDWANAQGHTAPTGTISLESDFHLQFGDQYIRLDLAPDALAFTAVPGAPKTISLLTEVWTKTSPDAPSVFAPSQLIEDHSGAWLYYDSSSDRIVRSTGAAGGSELLPLHVNETLKLYVFLDGHWHPLPHYLVEPFCVDDQGLVFSLSHNGFYGTAEIEHWPIQFNREIVLEWEHYRLKPAPVWRDDELFSDSCRLIEDQSESAPAPISRHQAGFYIGTRYFDTIQNLDALRALAAGAASIVLFRGVSVHKYLRYQPLVYYVAMGDDHHCRLLTASLETLIEIGRYADDLCVITDRADIRAFVPAPLRDRVLVHLVPSGFSPIDGKASRYMIVDVAGAHAYQPLLYLDTDVIAAEPIEPLLIAVVLANGISVGLENHPPLISAYRDSPSVGQTLFSWDGVWPTDEIGFNSGVLGLRNIALCAEPFAVIRKLIKAMYRSGTTGQWVDQPVANYVLRKLYNQRLTASISALVSYGAAEEVFTLAGTPDNPTLIHYCQTATEVRLEVMTQYLANWRATQSAG
jgi:hypothetical protein